MSSSFASMPCPVCSVPLTLSERQGVEIDYCPKCRGVWLDRGELDKIIERNIREASSHSASISHASAASPDYRRHHVAPQGYGYEKRRKSFLEELFD